MPKGDWISALKELLPGLAPGDWHWSKRDGCLSIAFPYMGNAIIVIGSNFAEQVCPELTEKFGACNMGATRN